MGSPDFEHFDGLSCSYRGLRPYHLLKTPEKVLRQILENYKMVNPDHLLDKFNRQTEIEPASWGWYSGMNCGLGIS